MEPIYDKMLALYRLSQSRDIILGNGGDNELAKFFELYEWIVPKWASIPRVYTWVVIDSYGIESWSDLEPYCVEYVWHFTGERKIVHQHLFIPREVNWIALKWKRPAFNGR